MTRLTIAVPTFERAALLESLLGVLERELAGRDDVDVLVADNASTDATPAVLERFASSLPLRVQRHAENVGPLENVRWLLVNAPGAHVWCIGDDDRPTPGAVARVLDLLEERDPVWLHLPHCWLRPDGAVADGSPVPAQVEEHAGAGDLYRAHGHWLTFLSASVLRSAEAARAAAEHPTENRYAPLVWFFRAAVGGRCLVADEVLVEGSDEISWSDLKAEIVTDHYTGLYDEAVGLELSPAEFAASLDTLYARDPQYLDLWRARPPVSLERALEAFPASRVLRQFLWLLARERGDRSGVERAARSADVAGAAARADALVAEGEAVYGQGDAARALALFEQAIGEAPAHVSAWVDLGVARHALGLPGALDAVEVALWNDPEDPEARANREQLLRL